MRKKRAKTNRRPNVFPHRAQPHAKGFSFVCVRSCLCTCSTRLRETQTSVSQYTVFIVHGGTKTRARFAPGLGLAWLGLAYLNRLLQYLQGRVLGFCCLPSAISPALPEMVAVSTD